MPSTIFTYCVILMMPVLNYNPDICKLSKMLYCMVSIYYAEQPKFPISLLNLNLCFFILYHNSNCIIDPITFVFLLCNLWYYNYESCNNLDLILGNCGLSTLSHRLTKGSRRTINYPILLALYLYQHIFYYLIDWLDWTLHIIK